MPTLLLSNSIAAGATVQNLVAGSKFEFLPQASAVRIYAVTNNNPDVDLDYTLGNVVVGDNLVVPQEPGATLGPDRDKNLIASGVGAGGDRIQLRASNANAGASVIRTLVEIVPL